MILRHPGLRLSMAGAVVFLASLISLLFLPLAPSVLGMLAGGMGVWGGFIWTILSFYTSSPGPPACS
jgi:hypothetical protein